MKYQPKQVSIFLNRICPRKCEYCNVVNPEIEKKHLSVQQWKKVFKNLKDLGTEFFLILGTEPLMMGSDLAELVRYWNELDIEYGLYTTSPEPWFSQNKQKLIDVGIRNWSSGIDFIQEVYEQGEWSDFTHELVGQQKEELIRKAKEAIRGMQEMQEHVKETLALITVSKMNIEMVPKICEWLTDNIKHIHIGLNFVEWSNEDSMDFATSGDLPFYFTSDDLPLLLDLSKQMHGLDDKYKVHIQTPLHYFDQYRHILALDRRCKLHTLAFGIDCDGSIRLCGYKILKENLTVNDLIENPSDVFKTIKSNWLNCNGWFWAFPSILEYYALDGVDFRSDWWKERVGD